MPPLKSVSFRTARRRGACRSGRLAVAHAMGYKTVTEAEKANADSHATARDLVDAVSTRWYGLEPGDVTWGCECIIREDPELVAALEDALGRAADAAYSEGKYDAGYAQRYYRNFRRLADKVLNDWEAKA